MAQKHPFSLSNLQDAGGPLLGARQLARCSQAGARKLLGRFLAESLKVLPISIMKLGRREVVVIAHATDAPLELGAKLRFAIEKEVKLVPVPGETLLSAISLAYGGDASVLDSRVRDLEKVREVPPPKVEAISSEHPIPNFLAALLEYALAKEASDIHLTPTASGTRVQMRVNGELHAHEAPVGNSTTHRQLISRLKVLCGLDIAERSTPLDGSFEFRLGNSSRTARVSMISTVHGEKAVVRLCSEELTRTLSALGVDPRTEGAVRAALTEAEGMVVVAGTTGSGKTTSLYAMLQELKNTSRSLVSVEDPVEARLSFVAQTEVSATRDYATCLKSILRQDPDIIMLGELRDAESAQMGVNAALTGHLLLTTIHARTAFDVLLRLRSFGIDRLALSQSVKLIIWQELVPTLCPHCRVIDLALSHRFGLEASRSVGCVRCHYTGSQGRTLLVESLSVDRSIAQLIASEELSRREFLKVLSERNYSSPFEHLAALVRAGTVGGAELLREGVDERERAAEP